MQYSWIWLPEDIYPEQQNTSFDSMSDGVKGNYAVAEFNKIYKFDKKAVSLSLIFSADTEAQIFCNGCIVATGPSSAGGDFLGNGKAREWYYSNKVSFDVDSDSLDFFARVKMGPMRMYEFSRGHGGFMLSATVMFEDGSSSLLSTDESWLVRKNGAFVRSCVYDGRILPDPYVKAEIVPDIWNVTIAPIPVTSEQKIPIERIILQPNETVTKELELDRIYAGLLQVCSEGAGIVHASFQISELGQVVEGEEIVTLKGNDEYRSFHLHSFGCVKVTLTNESDEQTAVNLGIIAVCYPVDVDAITETSDADINEVLDVCKHTLKYCRQTHHLDSPRHCEPLACTGDYYIESLMTAFSFGDMRLAEFDVTRTAELLRHNDGRIFHTTYSLIWVRMMYDVYMIGGNYAMLEKCRDALDMLLARFDTYVADNGLIENSPDYMFVDWIYIDGMSMHHPPKALGQTVLNMFYYMALDYAEKIYSLLGCEECSALCGEKKRSLQGAVNSLLYDAEKGIYFEGLNTPTAPELINWALPSNVEKRYYLKHSNIMAAYTSICDADTARDLIDKIMNDEIEGDVQPYFLHYLLEAIYDHGLRDKYTLDVIERWKPAVKECNKGLVEGFVTPEPTYSFDHSHAWGGTPLYSLPKALTGLIIEEPGYKKIKLNPSLMGLDKAKIEIPTPYGMIVCDLISGDKPNITVPDGILAEF